MNMNDVEIAVLIALMFIHGIIIGYIIWAPLTPFKQGFKDGLTFKFLRKKK
jgi:uncharacterized membrane protein YciS (DUF1049 family)